MSFGNDFFQDAYRRSDCAAGLKAFQENVHTILRRDCKYCHDTSGIGGAPHSVENVTASYSYTLSYVDWKNLEKSKFIKKVNEAHWIGKPNGDKVKTTPEEALQALRKWWDEGQKDCPTLGNYVSKPVSLALELKEWKRLSVLLPEESEQLNGARFSVEVMSDGTKYFLRKPLIENLKSGVRFRRVYVILNGHGYESPFSLLQGVTDPEAGKVSSVLSAYTTGIAVEDPTRDTLAFGFEVLKANPPTECKQLDRYRRDVAPVLKTRDCYYCHGGEGYEGVSAAKKRLDMSVTEAPLCKALLMRGSGKYTVESPLIAYPLRGVNEHSVELPHEGEALPSWVEWIKAEKVHQ